jgi:hypothetical protein
MRPSFIETPGSAFLVFFVQAFMALCLLFALLYGVTELAVFSLIILAMGMSAYLWSRASLKHVSCHIALNRRRLFPGEKFTIGIQSSFWHPVWVQQFLALKRGLVEWLVLISLLLCVWVLWFIGKRLSTKPAERTTIRQRFDIGLAFFLILLMIKLIIALKGVSIAGTHSSIRPIIAFVVLGLCSMGLVHTRPPS